MLRFALRGRWLALGLVVVVAAAVCVRLGIWQLSRLDEKRTLNQRVEARGELPVEPLDTVLGGVGADGEDPEDVEYRQVEVTGYYDAERQVLVRGVSFNGSPGQHVLTPLVTGEGQAVLVNRGFVPQVDPGAGVPDPARVPRGDVQVVGVLRQSDEGGRFDPAEPQVVAGGTIGHVNRVDVERLAEELPYDLVPAYVRIEAEVPERQGVPIPLQPVDPGEGPHLSYAVQWFSFATVFLVGWPVLVYRRWRQEDAGEQPPGPRGNGDRSPRGAASVPTG